jgi:hypothetical protein
MTRINCDRPRGIAEQPRYGLAGANVARSSGKADRNVRESGFAGDAPLCRGSRQR